MSPEERVQCATALATAERSHQPIAPLTDSYPDMSVADAYAIQRHNADGRVREGSRLCGHKVGLTARAMQELFGVFEPDYGHLFADMFELESSDVTFDKFISPRVEIEAAFVLGRILEGPGATTADALRAIDYVVPSIEIIDSRIANWRIRLADTIADNGSSAAVVLGGCPRRLTDFDLRDMSAAMQVDDQPVEEGNTGNVMGNPISALVWLANTLGRHGVSLKEGDVVLPGTCVRALPIKRGETVQGKFDGLGEVRIRFT